MKVRYVQQKHEHGCLIACIAMVLGWDYDQVAVEFKTDLTKRGTDGEFAKQFICDHGFSVIEKRGTGYLDRREHNKRMLEPFAPIHIVSVQQFIDRPKQNHAFVTDSRGEVYDPNDRDQKKVLFYEAVHVMGFWQA
jgi:hypothetical protein